MDDTRLLHAKSDAGDALETLYEIYRERQGDRSEVGTALRKAFTAARESFHLLVELMQPAFPICGDHHVLGAKCYRHAEHEGGHRSDLGQTWTDESNRKAGDEIAKLYKAGSRD